VHLSPSRLLRSISPLRDEFRHIQKHPREREAAGKGEVPRFPDRVEFRLEGLKDLPTTPHSHPFTTPPEVEEKILEVALEYPRWEYTKVSDYLKLQGVSVSSPAVQKIFITHDLASVFDRTLRLEKEYLDERIIRTRCF
jgi:hypothetical protein